MSCRKLNSREWFFHVNDSLVLELQNIIRALSIEDGVSRFSFRSNQAFGAQASGEAGILFRNDEMRQRAFRHWFWNYSMAGAGSVGLTNTRIITTNHEWAPKLHNAVYVVYRQNQLNSLPLEYPRRSSGWIRREATRRAHAYAIYLRNFELERLKTSFYLFIGKQVCWENQRASISFDEDDLMGFWNNEMGRQDRANMANIGYLDRPLTLFNRSWDSGRLIRNHQEVTREIQETIFYNDWWHN